MRRRNAGSLVPGGDSILEEVLVRSRLFLMAAVVLAVIGTPAGVMAASPAAAASRPCGTATAPRTYRHVIWIWMENRSYSDIIGNTSRAPYINSLAARCGC
jgi:phosphatidylinositol-3-phosphatase